MKFYSFIFGLIGCRWKGCQDQDKPENEYELHHIVPKSIGGTDMDGRKYLCKKHHHHIHNLLLKIVWPYVSDKEKAKEAIQKATLSNLQEKKV